LRATTSLHFATVPEDPENRDHVTSGNGVRYVPVDARGFRLAMGLRPLDLGNWLELDNEGVSQLALKRELIESHYNDVVAFDDPTHPAFAELLDEVRDNLTLYHPEFARELSGELHPLVAASLLVPEDLCVMVRAPDQWKLMGAVVCFPSRWRLADKIATSLDEIHAPVPGYADELARTTNSFFDRLIPQRAFWRLNWTLLDDAALFQPAGASRSFDEDPAHWQFRVERQTIRLLPGSSAAVFTIRTSVRPATQMVREVPTFARDVLTYLTQAPPATLEYKGWNKLAERWSQWFAEQISPRDMLQEPKSSQS
jgi:hypothetical protein